MEDLMFIIIAILFFGLSFGLIQFFNSLRGNNQEHK